MDLKLFVLFKQIDLKKKFNQRFLNWLAFSHNWMYTPTTQANTFIKEYRLLHITHFLDKIVKDMWIVKKITLPQHCIAQNVIVIVIIGRFKKTTFNKKWAEEPENPFQSYDVAKNGY